MNARKGTTRSPKVEAPLPRAPEGPAFFQLLAIARGIRFYLETGTKVNTAYTPEGMLRTATNITGRAYTSGNMGLRKAMADLEEMKAVRDAELKERMANAAG